MTKLINKTKQTENRRILRQRQTQAEKILWEHLRNKKLCNLKFRRQVSIAAYVVDFYCSSLRLAIEIDGKIHLKEFISKMDRIRQEQIESVGITFLRFRNEEIINEPFKIIERITSLIPRLYKEREKG